MGRLSAWCFKMYEAACDRGDMVTAGHYTKMFELWQSRGL
ncbi:hypothetical protein [Aeromonas phage PZL-Ah152]|uniref:Uncharacterized protein n=2 Tax=Armandvirus TaxID=3424952 RepID=A0AAE8XBS6_9CAUD|nr:hypothetical protein [Aeromonas phage PZL-Ah152]UAT28095.1 hypothetical protein [Aeromonas phage PZL-Ah8]